MNRRTRYRRRRCLVIGAGLAGLAAGHRLAKKGWAVTVLEARDRVGGRVLSHRFKEAPKLVCELGGEWIGRDHDHMRSLCRELKLHTTRHQFAYHFWNGVAGRLSRAYPPTVAPFSGPARRRLARFRDEYLRFSGAQRRELDQLDWWSQLRALGWNEPELLRRDLMDSTDFGETIRMTSAFSASGEYFESDRSDEMDRKIVGGNDSLPKALAAVIKSRSGIVLCGARVRRVRQNARGIEAFIHHRAAPFFADMCICSAPTREVLAIKWDPPLPSDRQHALAELQYARIVKTVVLCKERFWPNSKYGFSVFTNRISDFCFDATAFQRGSNMGVLCSYAIGDKADDVASETKRAIGHWISADVQRMLDKRAKPQDPVRVERYAWQRDRLTGGAYAFYRPGQWFSVRPVIAQPLGRVQFVGEHLADWQGFMEGAVDTGVGAAENL